MKYNNLDPLPLDTPVIELYRDGQLLTDIYNGCNLEGVSFSKGKITISLAVVHEAGKQPIGTRFTIIFDEAEVIEFEMGDNGLDDMSQFTDFTILGRNTVQLAVASSIKVTIKCAEMHLLGI